MKHYEHTRIREIYYKTFQNSAGKCESFLSQRRKTMYMKSIYSEAEIFNEYIVRKIPVNFRVLENITIEIYNFVGDL